MRFIIICVCLFSWHTSNKIIRAVFDSSKQDSESVSVDHTQIKHLHAPVSQKFYNILAVRASLRRVYHVTKVVKDVMEGTCCNRQYHDSWCADTLCIVCVCVGVIWKLHWWKWNVV